MTASGTLQPSRIDPRWLGVWAFSATWVVLAVLVETLLRSGVAQARVVLVEDLCRCLIIVAAAAALHWRAARGKGAARPLWQAFAWGITCFAFATVYLIITMDLLGLRAPVTTLRHVGYFGGMVCLGWAVLKLPSAFFLPTQRLQSLLDGLIISLAIFFIAWGGFLRRMVEINWSPGNPYALTLAYSLYSVALGMLWLFQESRMPRMRFGPTGILLRLAMGITLAWWLFYSIGNIQGWYRGFGMAQRSDVLFSFRYLCFGLAALWPGPTLEMVPEQHRRERQTFLPYLPSFFAMAYGTTLALEGRTFDPTMVATGAMLGVVLTIRHYLTVRDLDNLSLDLEDRVRRRTEELLHSQQELMKVQRSRLIGGMAAGFAHDLKNMVGVIRNWAQILRENPEPETLDRGLEAIDLASDKALGSVQQILAAGRLQSLAPQTFDLGDHIRAHGSSLEGALGGRARLVLDLGPGPLGVYMDPDKFGQTLMNLASNAADAMAGPGTLTLRAWKDAIEPFTVLEVSDDGTGIDPEILDRIFEPYFTTKAPGKGTGLGLSTVHGTILQSGGAMTVKSEPGRGSVFTLKLPAGVQ